jgi:hypothetical protein
LLTLSSWSVLLTGFRVGRFGTEALQSGPYRDALGG